MPEMLAVALLVIIDTGFLLGFCAELSITSAARQLAANFANTGWALNVCAARLLFFIPLTLTLYNNKQ